VGDIIADEVADAILDFRNCGQIGVYLRGFLFVRFRIVHRLPLLGSGRMDVSHRQK
jgi:hypothetical protein